MVLLAFDINYLKTFFLLFVSLFLCQTLQDFFFLTPIEHKCNLKIESDGKNDPRQVKLHNHLRSVTVSILSLYKCILMVPKTEVLKYDKYHRYLTNRMQQKKSAQTFFVYLLKVT